MATEREGWSWEPDGPIYCDRHQNTLAMDNEGIVRHKGTGDLCDEIPILRQRPGDHNPMSTKLAAARAVLADRERELLALKGPCSSSGCRLHFAHSGPCDIR